MSPLLFFPGCTRNAKVILALFTCSRVRIRSIFAGIQNRGVVVMLANGCGW